MCASKNMPDTAPNLLLSVMTNRCPRCRRGKLFTGSNPYNFSNFMDMPEHCPVCGQRYELQTGFYFGTGYVSYALSVGLMGVIFALWALVFGLSFNDNSMLWCLGTGIIILLTLQPVLQRLARSIWIAFFVRYDKHWKERRGSEERFA